MATRKSGTRKHAGLNSGTTSSGPSHPGPPDTALAEHAAEQDKLAASMPFNAGKPSEYAPADPARPPQGAHRKMPSATTGASTLSESNTSEKTSGPALEPQAPDGTLGAKRGNSAGQTLTTNQGVPIGSNQDSLKAGLRGPTLLEDFILREKITHFDHERIPERIVHARGSGAHGFFESYKALPQLTRATVFCRSRQADTGIRTLFNRRGRARLGRYRA
ncbi:MAG: catalase [Steroidobacteraceae bacterium]